MTIKKNQIADLLPALKTALPRENYLMLLMWCGDDSISAQRAGARMSMADWLLAKIPTLPTASQRFLFWYAIPAWLNEPVRHDLESWGKEMDQPQEVVISLLSIVNRLLDDLLGVSLILADGVFTGVTAGNENERDQYSF